MKIVGKILLVVIAISAISYVLGFFGEAADVAKEEFGPRAMLQKYEMFKDMSAQLDKKKADISVYKQRLTNLEESYEGESRRNWDRIDKEQMNQWNLEVAGVIASYNSLAAEYNAQMSKFNWKFANKGDLPKGATEPLPREYKPYEVGF